MVTVLGILFASALWLPPEPALTISLSLREEAGLSDVTLNDAGASTVRQLAFWTEGAMRPVTALPNTRSMFESPPVRWQ